MVSPQEFAQWVLKRFESLGRQSATIDRLVLAQADLQRRLARLENVPPTELPPTDIPVDLVHAEFARVDEFNAFLPGVSPPPHGKLVSPTPHTTWDMGFEFTNEPYGCINGPANERLKRGGQLLFPNTQALSYWPWAMAAKNKYTPKGNWRLELGKIEAALQTQFGSTYLPMKVPQPTATLRNYTLPDVEDGPVTGLGVGDDQQFTDGYAEWVNGMISNARGFNLDPRPVPGGVTLKDVGARDATALFELYVSAQLPVPWDQVKTLAAVAWARLIPDDPSQPMTPDVELGILLGIDLYGTPGRFAGDDGTLGQGRLARIASTWTPIVYFVGEHPTEPRVMSVSEAKRYLAINKPPFTPPQ